MRSSSNILQACNGVLIQNVEVKPGDLDLWATETEDKIMEGLFAEYPTQIPHPVYVLCYFDLQFWEADAGKIVEDYESKGLPPCPGKMYVWECPKEMEEGLW